MLKCVAESGDVEMVKLLLKDPRVDPSIPGNEGKQTRDVLITAAFRIACSKGHLEVVRVLLDDKRSDPIQDLGPPSI